MASCPHALAPLGLTRDDRRVAHDHPLIGRRVVLTGALSRKRAEVIAALEAAGAIVGRDVSSATEVLVAGARPGSKLARAQELDIEVWDEPELERQLQRAARPEDTAATRLARDARAKMRSSAIERGVDFSSYEPLVRDRIIVQALKDKPRNYGGVGQTRFGGNADLPSPEDWPTGPDLHFAFLCQIDLADVAPLDVGNRLPRSGLLSFFVGTPAVYGMYTPYRVEPRVLYWPAGTELQTTWPSWGTPRQRGMSFVLAPAPPPWNSNLVDNSDPLYCEWYDAWEPRDHNRPRTAMLGFDRVYESELLPGEEMLLCCWCHEDIDYPFVEAVNLNFAIDRDALARRDFAAVRCWEGSSI